MVVNILGTEYTVNLVTEQAEPRRNYERDRGGEL